MQNSLIKDIVYLEPKPEDGFFLNKLIKQSPPLDTNSVYCNILQCSHFSKTCVGAYSGDELYGFVSAYLLPDSPETLFIWQVVVSKILRKQGVALKMILSLLKRPHLKPCRYIATTITEDNISSWALFKKLSTTLETNLKKKIIFDKEHHFNNQHESEFLVEIGPINLNNLTI